MNQDNDKMDGYYRGLVVLQIKASKENIPLPWTTPSRKRSKSNSSVCEPQTTHVLIVGDAGVGKTSFINKKLGHRFNPMYQPTNRIDTYQSPGVIWYDYPGQDQFEIIPVDAPINFVIYMYDVTSKISYKNLSRWKERINNKYGNINSIDIGNKTDLTSYIKVRGGIIENSNKYR